MKMQESLKEMGTLLSVVLNKQRFNILPLDKMQWNSTLFYCGTLFLYMTKFLDFFGSTCKPATRIERSLSSYPSSPYFSYNSEVVQTI